MRRRAAGSVVGARTAARSSDQRPWTAAARRARRAREARAGARRARAATTRRGRELRRAQRRERVVGHLARPHEVPQRLLELLGRDAGDVGQQVGEEARAGGAAARGSRSCTRLGGRLAGARRRPEQRARPRGSRARRGRSGGRARPRRPTRPRPRRTAGPSTTASRRRCGAAARRAPTPRAGSASPCSGTSTSRSRSMPAPAGGWRSTPCQFGRKRASARWSAGSISLRSAASEARRSRRSTSGSHHSRVRAAGAQLAAHEVARRARARSSTGVRSSAVAVAQRARLERAVRARVAADEPLHRVRHVGDERLGQPGRRHGAERVAVQPGVLGRDPALLAADAQLAPRAARRASCSSHAVASPPGARDAPRRA